MQKAYWTQWAFMNKPEALAEATAKLSSQSVPGNACPKLWPKTALIWQTAHTLQADTFVTRTALTALPRQQEGSPSLAP